MRVAIAAAATAYLLWCVAFAGSLHLLAVSHDAPWSVLLVLALLVVTALLVWRFSPELQRLHLMPSTDLSPRQRMVNMAAGIAWAVASSLVLGTASSLAVLFVATLVVTSSLAAIIRLSQRFVS